MRNFGGILLLLGIFGFAYSSSQLEKHDPIPPGKSFEEAFDYPVAKWELARYACVGAAGVGLLLALFPKGR